MRPAFMTCLKEQPLPHLQNSQMRKRSLAEPQNGSQDFSSQQALVTSALTGPCKSYGRAYSHWREVYHPPRGEPWWPGGGKEYFIQTKYSNSTPTYAFEWTGNRYSNKYMYIHVHSSRIHKMWPKHVKTAQTFVNRWMDQRIIGHTHGTLFSHKNEA